MALLQELNQSRDKDRALIPFAVIGLVDIVSSAKISTTVSIFDEWRMKERFLSAANLRAKQNGIMILNHTGDGFLFMANPDGHDGWMPNLIAFHKSIVGDFQEILNSIGGKIGSVRSGLRCGVSAGPVLVGYADSARKQYMAVGSSVSLTARLCAMAEINEMLIADSAWSAQDTARISHDLEVERMIFDHLKGFDLEIAAFKISPQRQAQGPLRTAQIVKLLDRVVNRAVPNRDVTQSRRKVG